MVFSYSSAVNKSSIYIAKINPLMMTLLLVKTLGFEGRDINLIDLRNFLNKRCYT